MTVHNDSQEKSLRAVSHLLPDVLNSVYGFMVIIVRQ